MDSSDSHGAGNYAVDIYTTVGSIQGNFSNGTNQTLLTFSGVYADGNPHLISVVRVADTLYLYVDGALEDSGAVTGSINPSQSLNIGARNTGAEPFNGKILGAYIIDPSTFSYDFATYQTTIKNKFGI